MNSSILIGLSPPPAAPRNLKQLLPENGKMRPESYTTPPSAFVSMKGERRKKSNAEKERGVHNQP